MYGKFIVSFKGERMEFTFCNKTKVIVQHSPRMEALTHDLINNSVPVPFRKEGYYFYLGGSESYGVEYDVDWAYIGGHPGDILRMDNNLQKGEASSAVLPSYLTSSLLFDAMKRWLEKHLPGCSITVIDRSVPKMKKQFSKPKHNGGFWG